MAIRAKNKTLARYGPLHSSSAVPISRNGGGGDQLPPHSVEMERAALGCVLDVADSTTEQDALLQQLRPAMFYGEAEREIFLALMKLRMEAHAADRVMLFQRLRADNAPDGVIDLVNGFALEVTSVLNFPEYVRELRGYALRRWTLAKSARLTELAGSDTLTADNLTEEFSELYDKSQRIGQAARPRLKMWRVNDLMKWVAPPHLALVGDNEINMGYDGLTIIAGPGSSGKSLAAISLAICGATGDSHWQGRKVHRQFKSLFLQAENGSKRLREDLEGYIQARPEHADAINNSLFISDPPEGGLCFNNPEFRAAVRRQIEDLKPDLVFVDPWQSVAAEDAAKDVIEMLNLIRSCFPSGDQCPGLVIVAHTNKPRADVVRSGRNLVFNISGSVALVNTARCVYVLLPWTAELTDNRIYWACVKLNNGSMYAPSVWIRRKGAHFTHDPTTDPTTFGKTDDEDARRAITEDELRAIFDGVTELRKAEIAKRLEAKFKHAASTVYRAIDEDGYLRTFLMRSSVSAGKLKLKEPA